MSLRSHLNTYESGYMVTLEFEKLIAEEEQVGNEDSDSDTTSCLRCIAVD